VQVAVSFALRPAADCAAIFPFGRASFAGARRILPALYTKVSLSGGFSAYFCKYIFEEFLSHNNAKKLSPFNFDNTLLR